MGDNSREAGMIRFVRMGCFPRVRRLFFVRRAISSSTFDREGTTIRFVGLPFVSTSREGWRTGAVKPKGIRFGEVTVFCGVQKVFSVRRTATSGGFSC